ncbi:MAG: hypothetical protein A2044_03380 [Candidatus Firestonebacteria bacterium GWA2_43_8]|nr:MAG: hypothetical protein A2044_03380 [Candidatus Firestonebacteria bacterium GWA2_43_8]
MKKIFNKTLTGLLILISIVTVYYAAAVLKARVDTPRLIEEAAKKDNVTLQAGDLSKWQLDALLAIEDPKFYNHNGVDLKTPGAGITTITQGLVKKYYFNSFKPGIGKIKQTLIAVFALNSLVTKDDQLKLFINNIYLGNVEGKEVVGFDKAAKVYYKKPFNKLTKDEYLSIVAMIIAPENFNIIKNPGANAKRTERIKKVVSGEYKPKSLMDIYYGELAPEEQKGLAPASYYPSLYR